MNLNNRPLVGWMIFAVGLLIQPILAEVKDDGLTVAQARERLEESPSMGGNRLILVMLLFGSGDIKEAMEECEELLSSRNSSQRWAGRFEIFLMRSELGEGEAAKNALVKALKTPPTAKEKDDPWMLKLGRYLVGELGEDEFAKSHLPKVQDPHYHDRKYYMGMMRWISGDRDGALKHFREAVEVSRASSATYQAAKLRLRVYETTNPSSKP